MRPRHGDALDLQVDRGRGETVVTLKGELDLGGAPRLGAELRRAAESGGELVVDVAGLEFMDSSGLRELIIAHRDMPSVRVRGARGQVRKVIELTGTTVMLESRGPD